MTVAKGMVIHGNISRERVESAYRVVSGFFDEDLFFSVYVVKDIGELRRKAVELFGSDKHYEDWVKGIGRDDKIIVMDCEETDFVLVHEIAHLFTAKYFIHKNLLFWFIEGLPHYIAIKDNIPRGRLSGVPDFSKIITPQDFEKERNPYLASALFINYLVVKYGKAKLLSFLSELRDFPGKNFFESFEKTFGESLKDVNELFKNESSCEHRDNL